MKSIRIKRLIIIFFLFFFAVLITLFIPHFIISKKNTSLEAVKTNTENILKQLRTCQKNVDQSKCLIQVSILFTKNFTLKDSLAIIAENENDPSVYGVCHALTHYISRNEYKETHDLGEVYLSCNATCHGGCYHGAIEEYLREKKLDPASEEFSAAFMQTCTVLKGKTTPLSYFECEHGLGHAAMYVLNNELPDALKLCDKLGVDNREVCYSGVFMENSSSSTGPDLKSPYLNESDPLYPCTILDDQYLPLCYQYQSSYFSIISNYNWLKTINLCLQVPETYQLNCFKTIGTNQVGHTQDNSIMIKNCSLIKSNPHKAICLRGIVMSLANRYVEQPMKIISFCNKVPEEFKEGCYQQMGQSISIWFADPNQYKKNCALIPEKQFQDICIRK